jgi:hypothetical protein
MLVPFILKMAFLKRPASVFQTGSNFVARLADCVPFHHFNFIP